MVQILQRVEKEMYRHAESIYPEECCGLLFGVEHNGAKKVVEAIQLRNEEPAHREERFLVTPQDYRNAEKSAKGKNLQVIGCYHSHPNNQIAPSQYDVEHGIPSFVSIIIAVYCGRASGISVWLLHENRLGYNELED